MCVINPCITSMDMDMMSGMGWLMRLPSVGLGGV